MPRKPRIEVTERSLQTGLDVLLSDPRYKKRMADPFDEPSSPIRLKDTSRECRWFNGALGDDHVWRAKRKGWDNVRPDDVADLEQIGGHDVNAAGHIVRGERGKEVLLSMPKVVRQAIQIEKVRRNNANMGNPNATKREVVNAAGAQLGSEAADYLEARMGPVGEVTDTRERVERMDPD
jgi:hypothetical protein